MLNIVLHEPEIPANTGNIGRTCVATNTRLHLIEPLGFRLDEKNLKRAGMDYWGSLDVTTYIDYADFLERNPGAKIYMATTKAPKVYTEVSYEPDCYIMFGKESAGIPEEILVQHQEDCVRIPMVGDIRSLNLSNSVSIVLYEALRQNGFAGMNLEGHLHIRDIGGQTGDDAGGGKLVNVGKGEVLHIVVHVLPQVFGKPRRGLRRCFAGHGAEKQRDQAG